MLAGSIYDIINRSKDNQTSGKTLSMEKVINPFTFLPPIVKTRDTAMDLLGGALKIHQYLSM
uniref:Uncharacterized protein n=1 Tax=Caenorhabditis japonica TaxID=281687 RepID=A0A8R1IBI6_CAEJA